MHISIKLKLLKLLKLLILIILIIILICLNNSFFIFLNCINYIYDFFYKKPHASIFQLIYIEKAKVEKLNNSTYYIITNLKTLNITEIKEIY